MNNKYSHLLSPVKIGNLTFKNRIFASPTSLAELNPDQTHPRENIAYYRMRAVGGAASVTVGDCIVHPTGRAHVRQLMMCDPDCWPCMYEMVDAIHRGGAYASVQLNHGGKECSPPFVTDGIIYGPVSEVDEYGDEIVEAPVELLDEIIEGFAECAWQAKRIGFDMVMIHGGSTWLIQQFLSSITNRRTDEYGGSLENRARLLLRVVQAVRERVGRGYPIELRMNACEFVEGGITPEETAAVAKMVEPYVSAIHVMSAPGPGYDATQDIQGIERAFSSIFSRGGDLLEIAAQVKAAVSIPVSVVVGFSDPQMMEDAVASGKVDYINVGRALVADPFFPKKLMQGREDEVRMCIGCMHCNDSLNQLRKIRCTVNPYIGNELEYFHPGPAPKAKKRVLVVGGGPGGMNAALVAAERGHEVILCEKANELGGAINFARYVDFKYGIDRYRNWLVNMIGKANIDLRLNTEVTADYARELSPDAIIVAAGADPIIPPFEGVNAPNVILGTDAYTQPVGQRVVLIGGGLVGCETALDLAFKGHDVTVVEMQAEAAPEANPLYRPSLMSRLEKRAKILTSTRCEAITEDGVRCTGADGETLTLPADTVLLCVGLKPRAALVDELRGIAGEFYAVGDCSKAAKIIDAVHGGTAAAVCIGNV